MSRATWLTVVVVLSYVQTADAQSSNGHGRPAIAVRAERGVEINGFDDDAIWRSAQPISDFRQFDPELNAAPTLRTEFKVAYDDQRLYVFVRAFDAHPDSIMRALTRRDVRGPSDQIGIIIDSYNDRRTGFMFYVNPDGVKRDYSVFDDGAQDGSWNGVWDVATSVDSLGWTAEFSIPFSQLRYASADRHTFGFSVRREIERYAERVSWPAYDRTAPGLMSQIGQLENLEGLGASNRVELTPYAVTKNVTRTTVPGEYERVQQLDVGGDLKVGLTPNVTLNATVNPDFGQVEADPAVLNLTAFETFQSERRPFFVEGTGLYGFSLNCYIVVDCQTNEGLFYSRRIGRSPSLLGEYGDATTPTATPIAAAVKLTGRSAGGLSFGLLDVVTSPVDGVEDRTVEPRTNYAVLRAQQDLRGGEAGIGWIATAVNRSMDSFTSPFLHSSAYVTGVNVRNRFGNGQYEVAGSFAVSRVSGTEEVITATQRTSARYYQQPGDDLEVDPTRTSLSGSAVQVKVGKYGGGITRFESSFVRQTGGFEVNDLGFLRRSDIQDWSTWAALSFQNPTGVYRWMQINGNTWHHWNTSGVRLQTAVNFNAHMGLHNNWNLHAGGTLSRIGSPMCDRCTRGGPVLRQSRGLYPWFGVNADSRRAIVPNMWVNLGYWDDGRSHSRSLSPGVNFRVSTSLTARLGAGFSKVNDNTQWFGNFTDSTDVTHHAFAYIDQRTVSMNLRLNYTVTPDLTFEFYGEAFSSNGSYADLRETSATPDALEYVDRFQPYTPPDGEALSFSFRQLRTNAVLRWEYMPGSTLYLVWTQGRDSYLENGPRQPWTTDFQGLFDLHPDNTFLLKLSYWINR
jgi:hypothetical protein